MRAILVLNDMPTTCNECPLNSHTDYDFDVCWITQGKGECPLRPLPQKKEIELPWLYAEYENGWNDCLDEITGETE